MKVFISYIRILLLSTLFYNIKFSQVLMQILMKKLGIKIFIIVSCWNINIRVILVILESSSSRRVTSYFIWVGLVWNFSMSYHGPIRAEGLSVGTLIFGPLQALLTRWSYLGSLTTMGSFGELKSPSENLVNVQKDCSWLRAILKKLLRRG